MQTDTLTARAAAILAKRRTRRSNLRPSAGTAARRRRMIARMEA